MGVVWSASRDLSSPRLTLVAQQVLECVHSSSRAGPGEAFASAKRARPRGEKAPHFPPIPADHQRTKGVPILVGQEHTPVLHFKSMSYSALSSVSASLASLSPLTGISRPLAVEVGSTFEVFCGFIRQQGQWGGLRPTNVTRYKHESIVGTNRMHSCVQVSASIPLTLNKNPPHTCPQHDSPPPAVPKHLLINIPHLSSSS